MDIGVPIKNLGALDTAELRETILAADQDAWNEMNKRQEDYEVHYNTQSIVMYFATLTWPEVTVSKEIGYDRLAKAAQPIMDHIIETHYEPGGVILRAMAAKLLAGSNIKPHFDSLESFKHGHRIHVPITTNRQVRFMIDGKPNRLEVGNVYEINNLKIHSVMNAGKEDRITFIFDYVPPSIIKKEKATITHA